MKLVSTNLKTHLQSEVLTLAWCWRITRTDNTQLGFTTFDQDLTIDGLTYRASTGFFPAAIASSNDLAPNNSELSSILDDDSITEADLWGGKYDYARMDLFLVNYLSLPNSLTANPPEFLGLLSGFLGEVSHDDRSFTIQYKGASDLLNQTIIEQTSPTCRAVFGDNRCKKNLTGLTHSLVISTRTTDRIFSTAFTERDGYFAGGNLTFTSGQNSGLTFTIQSFIGGVISLFETPPFPVAIGNTITAVAGCDRTRGDCLRYGNILNFQGEPDIVGIDKILAGFEG